MNKIIGEISYGRFIIPYRVYGEAAKTIICLSGAKQTMSAWKSFIRYFQNDYRVVVFDMPGQGAAQILSGAQGVPLDEQVDVLNQIVIETCKDNAAQKFVVGGSWGSIVAAAYAAKYPEVFDRIILGSFGTKPNQVLSIIIDQVQELILAGRAREIAPIMIEKFGQYIPEVLKRQIIVQFNKMNNAQFQSFYEHSVFVKEMGDLKDYVSLPSIQAPTLVIMGQFDTIMDLFESRKAAAMIPQGQYLLAKGAGHFLHWEQESLLSVYADFFNEEGCELLEQQATC